MRTPVLLLLCITTVPGSSSCYSNVTLTSLGGELSVTVYLPAGIEEDADIFYRSSRFDHGSMIGSIQRTSSRGLLQDPKGARTHELYGTELWRTPHNPYWPESGVGLASEFGVGDDGANCDLRCGWNGVDDVANGVLGFQEALPGQSFLKIGVGELIKGSCPECDSTGIYMFNSPYQFAKPPEWTMERPSGDVVILTHEARLHQYGYRLVKTISLENNLLSVTSTLTNLGSTDFRTVWYSHHFYNCDAIPVGPGYALDLELHEKRPQVYEEPGNSGWTTPLGNYAQVTADEESLHVTMTRNVEEGTRIKAEFLKDSRSAGGFTLRGCGVAIHESVDDVKPYDPWTDLSMYGFNLYIERSTLSPEPQMLIHLRSGATTSWTQRLVFNDDNDATEMEGLPQHEQEAQHEQEQQLYLKSLGTTVESTSVMDDIGGLALVVVAICVAGLVVHKWTGRRSLYTRI